MAATLVDHECLAEPAPTVIVVDDDDDVRRAVCLLIRSVGLAEGSYASAQDFLDHFDPQKPGCLVVDIRMPGMSGLELQTGLNSTVVFPPIIFITAHGEIPSAIQAIRAGAVDFLEKPFSPRVLLKRIREAIDLDRENRCIRGLIGEIQVRVTQLTNRQREIMGFLAHGESTKHIARNLSISAKTVDSHRVKILGKMGVDNPTQLAHLVALLERPRDQLSKGP
jgi:two-component system, LuxR family, response regulator FixJ